MGLYTNDTEKLTLAIDTDAYAGNFERELFMFITGRPDASDGMTNSGMARYQELGKKALPDNSFFDSLLDQRINDPGDDGIHRAYVTICPTPGFFNVGGEHYPDADKNKAVLNNKMQHPAFQSVALFLQREPTAEELVYIKKRANLFADLPKKWEWDARPKILGFRLLRARTTWSSKAL